VIGRKGREEAGRITLTAHLDTKKGSPGAIDNATGITALLLLSELLSAKNGDFQIELVALNGEDYYSAPGQMVFIESKQGDFSDTFLNINVDGAGFHIGRTAYSMMELSEELAKISRNAFSPFPGMVEGKPWVQGDHSIFLQMGVPAIAISSEWLLENLQNQQITHTEKDHPRIVDPEKIVEIAMAVSALTEKLNLRGISLF
jgi:aminopeptidase YwaD